MSAPNGAGGHTMSAAHGRSEAALSPRGGPARGAGGQTMSRLAATALTLAVLLAGCGGGGGNSSPSGTGGTNAAGQAGGGGSTGTNGTGQTGGGGSTAGGSTGSGGSTGGGTTTGSGADASSTSGQNIMLAGATTPAADQTTIRVERFSAAKSTANLPYVTVTVCDPSARCVDVDHVLLDTGSFGLRVLASAVSALNLPVATSGGSSLAECATFISGSMWGNVAQATLKIGGEVANNVPIQVVGDSAAGTSPRACTGSGQDLNQASQIGANGVLGVGWLANDGNGGGGKYFACSGSACATATPVAPPAQPVTNPVTLFAQDNNGVIVQLPAIGSTGAASAIGLLTFGVGTETNNTIAADALLRITRRGVFTATLQGQSFGASFFDTGSNFSYATLAHVPLDSKNIYAPPAHIQIPAVLSSNDGLGTSINATLDAIALSSLNFSRDTAFNDILALGSAPGLSGAIDFGLPAYFGHTIALVFNGSSSPQGAGPLYAMH